MAAPFSTTPSPLTADDVTDQIKALCEKLVRFGDAVARLSFEGATSADFVREGSIGADSYRLSVEMALDDTRSLLAEALTGFVPTDHIDSLALGAAMKARIEANAATAARTEKWRERAAALREAQCVSCGSEASADTFLVDAAHARGAALLAAE